METKKELETKKKKCCEGCKKGQPGQNQACRARLIYNEKMKELK